MSEYFMAAGDPVTASLFRPSSMETVRSLGGDPLTLVSEMPLFITPGVGEVLGTAGSDTRPVAGAARCLEDAGNERRGSLGHHGDPPKAVA